MNKTNLKSKLFPRIGMRAIKTGLSVFLCCVIDFYRGVVPLQSAIAAILCIQSDSKNSVRVAITRATGTLLGGTIGVLVLELFSRLNIPSLSIPFYAILSVLLLLIIYIPVNLGWPDAVPLTCIVYMTIALSNPGEISSALFALNRVVDTLLGILIALPINAIFPNRQETKNT